MMKSTPKILLVCFLFLVIWSLPLSGRDTGLTLWPGVALAQAKPCPDVVKAALATTDKKCAGAGRNKACYGNIALSAEAQPGTANVTFAKPGDTTNLTSLRTIRLSALNVSANTWGIVVLRVQANLPDTAPGQNVTMLMFGDVGITDEPTGAALVSAAPATAPASAATTVATMAATAGASASSKPMQAFYFRTGIGDPACDEAPRDGILVQSPQGSKQKVTLSADGTQLELGSTIFLQAQAGTEMTVSTLEGSVAVTAFGKTETATAGTRVRVPLDASLNASGTPTPPEIYDYGTMLALPVKSLPNKSVKILVPKPPANAVSSKWRATFTTTFTSASCPSGTNTATLTFQMDPSGKTLWLSGAGPSGILTSTGQDTFSGVVADPYFTIRLTMHFTSPTHADGQGTYSGACAGSFKATYDKIS